MHRAAAYVQGSKQRLCSVEMAGGILQRTFGLMFRRRIGTNEGMLLSPCSGVHTFWMRFPIDVVALDRQYRVVGLDEWVAPWRISFRTLGRQTKRVLELHAGRCAEIGINIGDVIEIREDENFDYHMN